MSWLQIIRRFLLVYAIYLRGRPLSLLGTRYGNSIITWQTLELESWKYSQVVYQKVYYQGALITPRLR